MRDPYQVLGLKKSADETEVKQAFRRLAKVHHPDQNADDPKAKERFAEINSAYEILGDKDKRGKFDRGEIDADGKPRAAGFDGFSQNGFQAGGFRPASDFQTAGGADDILREIFGDALGGVGRGRGRGRRAEADMSAGSAAPARGGDVALVALVRLEDIVGSGKARVVMPDGRTLAVTLPPGVEPGQQIRLKGQGAAGTGGAGDAIVTVVFEPHPIFRSDGANLRADALVRLDEAVLGTRVRVPTLEGDVELVVPLGTTGDRPLRVRGRGLPTKAGGRGDLLVTPRIVLPEEPDSGLEQLMRRWQEMKTHGA